MPRPNPIIKLKRNSTVAPTVLQPGELAVSYSNNRIYVGNDSNTPIPIAAQVRNTLSGPSVTADDNFITTQRAVKDYVSSVVSPPSIPKGYALAQGYGQQISFGANQRYFTELGFYDIIQDADTFLTSAPGTGIINISITAVTLAVTYSIHIQSPDFAWPNTNPVDYVLTEANSNYTYRRTGIFLKQTNTITNTVLSTEYFGIQTQYPIFCTDQIEYNSGRGLPTMMNGSAVIKLPSSTASGSQWEIGLFTDVRTTEGASQNLFAGDPDGVVATNFGFANGAIGINDPPMSNLTLAGPVGIKLEMLKIT